MEEVWCSEMGKEGLIKVCLLREIETWDLLVEKGTV